MADDIDRANDLAEMERNQAVRDAQRSTGPHYTGMCWNCSEPLEQGVFCDVECGSDYEMRKRFKR